MDTIPVKLLSRYVIASGTMAFELEKPKGYDFQSGQHTVVHLPELRYEDKRGASRPFTIASAPSADTLLIVTRQTGSGFKKTWQELPLESEIGIANAHGELVLEENTPAVFLTGGIGITPFRSMILDLYHKESTTPLTLIYSNKTVATAAFHSFFNRVIKDFKTLTYIPTLTDIQTHHEEWKGETRKVDESFIRDYVEDLTAPIFYISGPPSMVTDLTDVLKQVGISEPKIKSESFFGYE